MFPNSNMNIIEIHDLTHRFSNGSLGLSGIDLTIKKGQFVVIAGKNGSGKTTLLMHLNGLLRPTQGTVWVAGGLVSENLSRVRQVVGMVFQNPDSQIVGESVYDDVAFGPENLALDQTEIKNRVTHAIGKVSLDKLVDERPHLLSVGEKRRLAIAGILAMRPKIIVFDEPFASLDYPGIREVLKEILKLHQSGHTIILATHDLEKIIAHAERLIIMDKGEIAQDGHPAGLVKKVEAYGVREPCPSRWGKEMDSWLN